MKNYWKILTDIGVHRSYDLIEKRRIRLLNSSVFISLILIIIFVILNIASGSYDHAIILSLSIFIVVLPVLLLTGYNYYKFSRIYFTVVLLIILNLLGHKSMSMDQNRYNELTFLAISTIIVIIFDGRLKTIMFMSAVISAVVMIVVRWNFQANIDSYELMFVIGNMLIAFVCIYIFTSMYRKDLESNLTKLQDFGNRLKKKNSEIEESRFTLRSLINNIPIFLAMLDVNGKYIIVNNRYSNAFLKDIDQIEGKLAAELMPKKINQVHKAFIADCLDGKDPVLDQSIVIGNGEKLHVYGKAIPIKDQEGNIKAFIEYGIDVTKLKEAEAELKELNLTKDKLISILSHDLRAPLNSLKGLFYISDTLEKEQIAEFMKGIQNQVETVSFTMDNLLSWTKSQLNGFIVSPQNLNTKKLLEHAVALYSSQLKDKKIQIKYDVDGDMSINADKDHMALVFRNLINNAIKYSPSEGIIKVACYHRQNKSIISIKDNGIGMSPEYVSNLINDKKKKTTRLGTLGEVGTGLGLGYCRDVLLLNNAQLEIISEENKGTEMRIAFTDAKEVNVENESVIS